MLSFLFIGFPKLATNNLCDVLAPELACSSTWWNLYINFYGIVCPLPIVWVRLFRDSSTPLQLLWVQTFVFWSHGWSWLFYLFHCCCFCCHCFVVYFHPQCWENLSHEFVMCSRMVVCTIIGISYYLATNKNETAVAICSHGASRSAFPLPWLL